MSLQASGQYKEANKWGRDGNDDPVLGLLNSDKSSDSLALIVFLSSGLWTARYLVASSPFEEVPGPQESCPC